MSSERLRTHLRILIVSIQRLTSRNNVVIETSDGAILSSIFIIFCKCEKAAVYPAKFARQLKLKSHVLETICYSDNIMRK